MRGLRTSSGRACAWTAVLLGLGGAPGAQASEPAPLPMTERWSLTGPQRSISPSVTVDERRDRVYVVRAEIVDRFFSDFDTVVVALDRRTGAEVWRASFGSELQDWDLPASVQLSPDGERLHLGIAAREAGDTTRWRVVTLDAGTGQRRWVARYQNDDPAEGHYDAPRRVLVRPDGTLVVVGLSSALRRTPKFVVDVVAFDGRSGQELWRRSVHSGAATTAVDAELTDDGRGLTVLARDEDDDGRDAGVVVMGLDAADGERRWVHREGGKDMTDVPMELAVGPDGTAYAVGYAVGSGGDTAQQQVTALDGGDGSVLWRAGWSASPGSFDVPLDAVPSSSGRRLFVIGTSGLGEGSDWTVSVLETVRGTRLWSRSHSAPGARRDEAMAGALSPDEALLHVTGREQGGGAEEQIRTITYDALTGTPVRTAAHRSPGEGLNLRPDDLVVDPGGERLYVTGEDRGRAVVLAYCASLASSLRGC